MPAARYWETGDEDTAFRYNNYLSRFHWRHVDLMDVLSGFQGRGRASLDDMSHGSSAFRASSACRAPTSGMPTRRGEIAAIRNYCETDVLNTYLIYLRFQLIRGRLTVAEHKAEIARARALLAEPARRISPSFSPPGPTRRAGAA